MCVFDAGLPGARGQPQGLPGLGPQEACAGDAAWCVPSKWGESLRLYKA